MAATLDEELLLKQCVKEIIDEKYSTQLHELNENLALARGREKELLDRLVSYDKELERYRQCHKCHNEIFERRDASTQTTEQYSDKKQSSKHQHVVQSSPQPQPVKHPPSTFKKPTSPSSKYLCSSSRQVPKSTSKNNHPSTSKQSTTGVFKQPLPPQTVPISPFPTKQTGSIPKQTPPSTSKNPPTVVTGDTSIKNQTTQTSKGNLSSVKEEMNMPPNNPDHNQNVSERNGRESVDSMEVESEPEFIDLTIDSD